MGNVQNFDIELVGFSGFYSGLFSDYLTNQLDNDLMNLHDSLSKLKINEFSCWYSMENKKFKTDVAELVMNNFLSTADTLCKDIFELKPTGKKAEVYSPKQHNFVTDRIFKEIEVKESDYNRLVGYLLSLPKKDYAIVQEVIARNFTDYDGFHSYYPNTLDYWLHIKWSDLTDLKLSYLYLCLLCVRLSHSDNWSFNEDGAKLYTAEELYDNFEDKIEMEVFEDNDFYYTEYTNWELYKRELIYALGKNEVKVDLDSDVVDCCLWQLVDDWKINENNELVLQRS